VVLFEFTVAGPPVSAQATNRARVRAWKQRVRAAAEARWDHRRNPFPGRIQIVATYYHDGEAVRLDLDNAIKPIQDALNRLVYTDDRQITDAQLRKTNLDSNFRVRGMSSVLAEAFVQGVEFVHIRIEDAPDHAVLP
jgi:crossover junction endodeoxyribonuclease RusA